MARSGSLMRLFEKIIRRLRELIDVLIKRRQCPLCEWRGFRFRPFGDFLSFRKDAMCPVCGSLERHRLAFLLLKDTIEPHQRVLHVAPERCLIPWFVSLSSEYVNADFCSPAMRQMDLTHIDLLDSSKTLIWCSHVLDYISNEKAALSELFRVLAPGGILVLQVRINGALTLEVSAVADKDERMQKLFDETKVRLYGMDLKERITDSCFSCNVISSSSLSERDQIMYGLRTPGYRDVFICRKPSTEKGGGYARLRGIARGRS